MNIEHWTLNKNRIKTKNEIHKFPTLDNNEMYIDIYNTLRNSMDLLFILFVASVIENKYNHIQVKSHGMQTLISNFKSLSKCSGVCAYMTAGYLPSYLE